MAIVDHFEPRRGQGAANSARGRAIVERWAGECPKLFEKFRDADGRPPRHSFFWPIEEYAPEEVEALGPLCRAGLGEVEVHLHHDDDTSEGLRRALVEGTVALRERHGQLARDPTTNETKFGFAHGNWALDNSRPDGRWCGVNDELDVLRECGCYADFTFPSAPSPTQPPTINQLYWAVDDPLRPRSHDFGPRLGTVPRPERSLLMVQGPLVWDWSRRKRGIVPRLENGNVQGPQPLSVARVPNWLRARVQVPTRPDWYFVKLHTHGADDRNIGSLLGPETVAFHEGLAKMAAADDDFTVHYVTAREMANLALAAESGWTGDVAGARDFRLAWNGGRG